MDFEVSTLITKVVRSLRIIKIETEKGISNRKVDPTMTVITHNLQSGNTKSNSSADFKPECGTVAYGMFWWLRNNFQPLIEMVFLRSYNTYTGMMEK
ncbi:hypothetical protein CDAR_74261 [Caerostris darwini]|uniref:Uncharacterized protein n=1 Tax=Caerostris darwini TaxID=1538125 RepID=A0AAV4UJN5_9ARAC|nr:hypothetical protein CDAR_74261 [Caerostris darwini]